MISGVLAHLDRFLTEPALGNAYFPPLDLRMSVFRSGAHWALFFEEVTCDWQGSEVEVWLFAYGDCLARQGRLNDEDHRHPLQWPADRPPQDYHTGAWLLDREGFSVLVDGGRHDLRPTPADCAAAGVTFGAEQPGSGPGSLTATQAARLVCHLLGHPLFSPEPHLRSVLARHWAPVDGSPSEMGLLLQTREWRHPDLDIAEERPGDTECFRVLAACIETGDRSGWDRLDPGTFNTRWEQLPGYEVP